MTSIDASSIPTSLPEDRYVTAIEYRVGNRRVVHHILAYVDVSGKARKRDAADPGPGYSCFAGPGEPISGDLGGWAPGIQPSPLPEGIGRLLPKGADIIVQLHYHPSGKPETDRTRIGLHFARKPDPPDAPLDRRDQPRPRAAARETPTSRSRPQWPVPVDLVAHAVTPHMHLLGRDIAMSVTFPDGRVQDLIKIDDWDFNWQYSYFFEKPLDLPKGSVLNVVSHYDNTSSNPRNPNKPPKLVKWGEATTDEMCVGFIAVTKKGQDLTRPGEKDDLDGDLPQAARGVPGPSRAGDQGSPGEGRQEPRRRRQVKGPERTGTGPGANPLLDHVIPESAQGPHPACSGSTRSPGRSVPWPASLATRRVRPRHGGPGPAPTGIVRTAGRTRSRAAART